MPTITVTTLADAGAGSLRAAIASAGVGDTIVFSVTGSIHLTSGTLTITQDVIITGPGFSFLTIDTTHAQRIFTITGGLVTITGLTMQGGNPIFDPFGGNLKNEGTLTLSGCIVKGGQAIDGGGIYNLGTITADNCLITLNGCTGGDPNARGGGIWNDGTLEMHFCRIDSNTVNGSAPVAGGGIWNDGTVWAIACQITSNTAIGTDPFGGGLYNEGTALVYQGTVDNNFCTGSTNGAPGQGAGISSLFGTLMVEFSTVSNNTATGFSVGTAGGDAQGGGIFSAEGNSTYVNSSTISTNHCLAGTGSVTNGAAQGGAMWNDVAVAVQVNNSTLTLNSSGCYIVLGGTFLPYNSIIAGDVGNSIEGNDPSGSIHFISQGHNIFGPTSIAYTPGAGDFLSWVGPLNMGPLAMNGGTTLTHALLGGSIAIDAGDNTDPPASPHPPPGPPPPALVPLLTDQRGVTRILNGTIDIGAYESTPVVEFCVDADTYCQTLTNPTEEEIAAAQAAVDAQALADAEAQAGSPTACCTAPYFETQTHTETLSSSVPTRYSFTATAGRSLSFWSTSQDGQFGLRLYDSDGVTELANDSVPNRDQRGWWGGGATAAPKAVAGITYTFPTDNTYFIDVEKWGTAGTYTLYITAVDQPGVVANDPFQRIQFASCYVTSTKKMFTCALGQTGSDTCNVNIFDAVTLTLINTVVVSAVGTNTGIGRIVFYNANDNSVWLIARVPATGAWVFIRLDPTVGIILETFSPPPITNVTPTQGLYCPENNKIYIGSAPPAHANSFNQIEIFDCGARTWSTPIPVTGATIQLSSPNYTYDPVSRKLWAIINFGTPGPVTLMVTIDTTTDTGVTTTLANDFGLHGAYPPFINGLIWGTSDGLHRIGTLDPNLGVFTGLEYQTPTSYGINAFAYDPCRNCMVMASSAEAIYFEDGPFPASPWGVAYYGRLAIMDGSWIETAIVEQLRAPISHAPERPLWVHMVWNPNTSRMTFFSSGQNYQV